MTLVLVGTQFLYFLELEKYVAKINMTVTERLSSYTNFIEKMLSLLSFLSITFNLGIVES